jgi:hypothetical protein
MLFAVETTPSAPPTPETGVAQLDALITSIEAMPSAPVPTDLAVNLYQAVTDVVLLTRNAGMSMLSTIDNVFVVDQISLALSDLNKASEALETANGKGRFFTSQALKTAHRANAPTVDIPNYRRLLGDALKASRRTMESLSAIEGFRPKFVDIVTGFFKPVVAVHEAVTDYIAKFKADVEKAARDEVDKQSKKPREEASNAAFWVKVAAGGVIVATGIWLYSYVKRQKLLPPAAPRLRHR